MNLESCMCVCECKGESCVGWDVLSLEVPSTLARDLNFEAKHELLKSTIHNIYHIHCITTRSLIWTCPDAGTEPDFIPASQRI